ncbi:hypothetical protein EOL94_04050 [bacterium]|nr:hypothetical protein [bacterium]
MQKKILPHDGEVYKPDYQIIYNAGLGYRNMRPLTEREKEALDLLFQIETLDYESFDIETYGRNLMSPICDIPQETDESKEYLEKVIKYLKELE